MSIFLTVLQGIWPVCLKTQSGFTTASLSHCDFFESHVETKRKKINKRRIYIYIYTHIVWINNINSYYYLSINITSDKTC